MGLELSSEPVRIGLVVAEPLRMAGIASVFEEACDECSIPLVPVLGSMEELLACPTLGHMLVDLLSGQNGLGMLETIRGVRPDIRLIVIGPAGDDELVMNSIMAGARAYLDSAAGPAVVRQAIEVVTEGSIWAPRHLLSRVIDGLLKNPESSLMSAAPHLTEREKQVLALILMARSNREIAQNLGIEERTVKAHVGRLMRKTGSGNRIGLSIRALNQSLMEGGDVVQDRRRGDRRQGSTTTSFSLPMAE